MIRQAFRANPWAFLGPAATQALAAALVTTGLGLTASLDGVPPDNGIADLGIIFTLSSAYLTVLVVGVTMGTAIAGQARDMALVRTIGATPGRVRRAIAAQAVLVALPATAAGIPLGLLAGYAWWHGLAGAGVVPSEATFRVYGGTVPIAYAVTVGTSLLGALVAAIRPSRLRPSVALTEALVSRRGRGRVRTAIGVLLLAGGVTLAVVISGFDAATADQAGLFVMLAMCVGAGLLGPVLLRVTLPVVRRLGPVGALAADAVTARARSLSGALVPLTLAVAFAAFTVVLGTTTAHVTGVAAPAADRWLEYSGTGAYTAFAAVAAVNTLLTVMHARRRELAVVRLAGGTRGRTLAVVVCEALVVTSTALAAGAAVAATTLLPLLHTALGTWRPWLPVSWLVAGIAGTTALVFAGMVGPAAAALRRPPIEVAG
ncbi:ABC transporter permease [Actinoplanes sp. LDG1-06]|uniref:ABC transporter permease n=1 Tax=Paractinoplanes ovalisporus TaxID=2810368 RepID=A0ABS2AIC5_9ACTN|nr:FtsX-like permease family protein [Actinoplanes ovalisporus]MBM2619591.1 ABC transporter permease [Actinoplanes ovalisporus]